LISSRTKWVPIALLSFIYLGGGLYPFHWSPPFITYRNVAQQGPEGGWKFSAPGIVKTLHAPEWLSEAIDTGSLEIALEIRPSRNDQTGPARILSISKDPYNQNLIVAQEGKSLIVRVRTPKTSLSGLPNHEIDDVFAQPEWQRVQMSIESGQVRVRINGTERLTASLPERAFSVWARDYSLALGNEMTFDRPWLGEIRRAEITIGRETFDYGSEEPLAVPRQYTVPRNACLVQIVPLSCSTLDRHRLFDWAVNLVGFVPFGILFARWLGGVNTVFRAAFASCALSLSIEIGQIFVPGRYSSTEDLLLNVAGGALGALLALRLFSSKAPDHGAPAALEATRSL
jgi:hypothetical protein